MNGFWSTVIEQLLGQFVALVAFFAFPIIQYIFLKRTSRNEGQPELWYLPKYGFRLVVRNLPRKRVISDIRQKTIIRNIILKSTGSSVASYIDETLVEQEDFFLFPGNDQVLISFRLMGERETDIDFVYTDKLGIERKRVPLSSFDRLITDYTGNIENLFNFDIRIAKSVEIKSTSLLEYWREIQRDNQETGFPVDRVRNVS